MKPQFERAALALVLVFAAALRLWHVDFGLPALNDPDEPLFVMTAVDMLRDGRLNPGWFGHPATALFYALALVFLLVGLAGMALGQWHSVDGFVTAVYADPAIAFLPMRVFIVLCGVACVYLTYRMGQRALGPWAGLLAAAILAVNGLHVEYSQVIRTDMLASVFMLASTLFAMRAAEDSRLMDLALAGVMAGLACATKWPAGAVVLNAMVVAAACRGGGKHGVFRVLVPIGAAFAGLIAASPFLVIDFATVMRDLGGEARPVHLGSTGGSFGRNLGWYVAHAFAPSFGIVGAMLAGLGVAIAPLRARWLAIAAFPGAAAFLIGISAQALVWERWAVPVLPFAALGIAVSARALARWLPTRGRHAALGLAAALLLGVPLHATYVRSTMRADDTRQAAARWVLAHVDGGSSILVEHAAFDLLKREGPLLFPLGRAGCVDVRRALESKPRYGKVNALRSNRAIVDIGHLEAGELATCRADFAIFTQFARYAGEGRSFAPQLANYQRLLRGGRIIAAFAPIPGERGGPVVHIVALARKGHPAAVRR